MGVRWPGDRVPNASAPARVWGEMVVVRGPVTQPSRICMREGGGGGDGPVMWPSRVCMREGSGGGWWVVDGGMVGGLSERA